MTPEQEARADQADRGLAEGPAEVRRHRGCDRRRLRVDRRRRHRQRALHQAVAHRGRRLPRPDAARVARVHGRRRQPHVGRRDVHRQRPPDRRPELLGFAGPLMQWHNHGNLCWGTGPDGKPSVVGITDANGNCANGVNTGGAEPDGARVGHTAPVRRVRRARGRRRRAGRGARRPARRHVQPAAHAPRRGRRRRSRTTRRSRSTSAASPASRPSSRPLPRTSSHSTSFACRSGPTTRSPRPPASTASATG